MGKKSGKAKEIVLEIVEGDNPPQNPPNPEPPKPKDKSIPPLPPEPLPPEPPKTRPWWSYLV